MPNPLDDLVRGFEVLRHNVPQRLSGEADWTDRLDLGGPPRSRDASPPRTRTA
jgi:hypothetical protein